MKTFHKTICLPEIFVDSIKTDKILLRNGENCSFFFDIFSEQSIVFFLTMWSRKPLFCRFCDGTPTWKRNRYRKSDTQDGGGRDAGISWHLGMSYLLTATPPAIFTLFTHLINEMFSHEIERTIRGNREILNLDNRWIWKSNDKN